MFDAHNTIPKKREKECIWCVFKSHTDSVSERKLNHKYCCEKWRLGEQPYFSIISFKYRWLEIIKNMEIVLKSVLNYSEDLQNRKKRVELSHYGIRNIATIQD